MFRRPVRRVRLAACAMLATAALVASGCADFSEQDNTARAGEFSENPVPEIMPPPPPAPPNPAEEDEEGGPLPEGPCVDPNPSVIAACLDSTGGLQPAAPDGLSTIVAERTTGRIFISKRFGPQREIASTAVDGSGDGGLIDFELSPTYDQDQLIYALITTPSDNRVVRIAGDEAPTPILTGIPKGDTGNMGSLDFRSPTALVVATGNGGDQAAAGNPGSLAGKILEINPDVPNGPPRIIASGFGSNVALCRDADDGRLYAADDAEGGRLFQLSADGEQLLWQWADSPGVAGCAAGSGMISVSMSEAKRIDTFAAPTVERPTIEPPTENDLADMYGAIGRITPITGGAVQLATVNKHTAGTELVPSDDRVAIYMPNGGAGSAEEDRM